MCGVIASKSPRCQQSFGVEHLADRTIEKNISATAAVYSRVFVRVVFFAESTVCLLDLFVRCVFVDGKQFVVIFGT